MKMEAKITDCFRRTFRLVNYCYHNICDSLYKINRNILSNDTFVVVFVTVGRLKQYGH
jgi:hypothetical protein